MLYFYILLLGLLWLTLACSKLVCFCGGCACYLSFRLYLGKNGETREGGEGAEKDSMHTSRHRKNATEDDSNLPHTPANINERQQEYKEPGAKILMNIVARTAGWRSSLSNGAGWISSLSNGAHWRKPNKRRRGPGAETSLQQPQHHSQRKLSLSNVLFQFLLGVRRGHVGEENAL